MSLSAFSTVVAGSTKKTSGLRARICLTVVDIETSLQRATDVRCVPDRGWVVGQV